MLLKRLQMQLRESPREYIWSFINWWASRGSYWHATQCARGVIASTFDREPQEHVKIANIVCLKKQNV
jgi:hypothetical protein